MSFKNLIGASCLTIALFGVSTECNAGEILWKGDIINKKHEALLTEKPKVGYGGALPYTRINGDTLLLISREGHGKIHSKGTYAEFGGKVDPNYSLIETVAKELYEESSGALKFDEDYLRNNSRGLYKTNGSNSKLVLFTYINYTKTQVFMDALKDIQTNKNNPNYNKHPFMEKDDFIWVTAGSLCEVLRSGFTKNAVTVDIYDDSGSIKQQQLKLRNILQNTILDSKEIFNKKMVLSKNLSLKIFPNSFNPNLYIILHPGLINEAKKMGFGVDSIEYAKWQYKYYGYNNGLNYLPIDFNPELYIQIHPELKNEAQKMDPIDYAKWQYAFHGYKGLNYLPIDFNPKLYIQIYPGLKNEAQEKKMDPIVYAKWQYAFHGYKGLNYLPLDFDPEVYAQKNNGIIAEAINWKWDLPKYAKWHYAMHGFEGGLAYK